MFIALGIHYLTGYATATDTASRDRAEWPPHPARIFMALVAAHYEGSANATPDAAERAALEWLETLPAPAMKVSDADPRNVVTHYVPVNDKASSPNRPNRQPRTFPKTRPQDDRVFLFWETPNDATRDAAALHAPALARLCAKVTRIGHSSSLVQMWLAANGTAPPNAALPAPDLFPTPENAIARCNVASEKTFPLRIPTTGTFAYLAETFNAQNGAFPTLALTCTYSRRDTFTAATNRNCANASTTSSFDDNLLILAKLDGPALGLESTARLTTALRGAILKKCSQLGALPEWLSGHASNGAATANPHLALLPLAFAGHEHADGHLLGIALAFPRTITPRERAKWLRPLLYAADAEGSVAPATITLTLGELGAWTLAREERATPPFALRPETWCRPATEWASVTPVVLERHIKSKPDEPGKRFAEIAASVAESCERIGLPRPAEVDVDKNAFHVGVPRSKPDKSGFPLLVPDRQQIHTYLRFDEPITGPILLGAGRYRGYGLLKPLAKN